MNKKIPFYLVDKDYNIASVLFSVLFGVVFINLYTPFSSTAWFEMSKSMYFVYTVGVIGIATGIIILSRFLMYLFRNELRMNYWQYAAWLIAEVLVIAVFYSFITIRYIYPETSFGKVLGKGFFYTALILIIPYSVSMLYGALNDKNKTLSLLRYNENVISDNDHHDEVDLVHLTDNNGVLKLSVKLENLYYIESQDNYIKIYYIHQGTLTNYMLRCKLKTIEESFAGTSLVRCHRSYIINANKVRIMRKEKDGLMVDMDYDKIKAIPVSKSYAKEVLRYFTKNERFEGYKNNVRKI